MQDDSNTPVQITAYVRRLNRSGRPLYIRLDRRELADALLREGDAVRLDLNGLLIEGVVKTAEGSPWLGAPPGKKGAISEALIGRGLEHGDDVVARVTREVHGEATSSGQDAIEAERQRREQLWHMLTSGGDPERTSSNRLRELGILDSPEEGQPPSEVTRRLTPNGQGLAIGLRYAADHDSEDLDESGALYRYPAPRRSREQGTGLVESIRAAGEVQLPMFLAEELQDGQFRVRRAWLAQDDADNRTFFLAFDERSAAHVAESPRDRERFALDDLDRTIVDDASAARRPGQARFRFDVFQRYGAACCVCGLPWPETLEAAHIKPWAERGTDDPRNGLPLCRNHHRLFDLGMFGIEPDTGHLVAASDGPTLAELHVAVADLSALPAQPSPEALRWAWNEVSRRRRG